MEQPYLATKTLDDLIRCVFTVLLDEGVVNTATRGANLELTGVLLELTNPRARLSRTETRGKLFSSLGELFWYLAGSDDLSFISYYIKDHYEKSAIDGRVEGAYGPRLFHWKGLNQFEAIVQLLSAKPTSRRAVIQLFDAADLQSLDTDVPCTCTLQFFVRDHSLDMLTYMRSQDAYLGLPHDVFAFTMLQEILARKLSVELGTYKHAVGSIHLYEKNLDSARAYLDEGWQPTTPMPPMPSGDPWLAIESLISWEERIRLGRASMPPSLGELDPYWADIVRLLCIYHLTRNRTRDDATAGVIESQMDSDVYRAYIEGRTLR